jgi:hypothetical protein
MPGRCLRISLRLAILLLLLVSAGLGWFSVSKLQPYREEASAARQLLELGAQMEFAPRPPLWFWGVFGEDVARYPAYLEAGGLTLGDEQVPLVANLRSLEFLNLDRSKLTDAGALQLGGLTKLKGLLLRHTAISRLPTREMASLMSLDLAHTEIAKLDSSAFSTLEFLNLRATRIHDATLASLGPMPELRTLDLAGDERRPMSVTDAGLAHLTPSKFPKLSRIYLYYTAVTPEGLAALAARFPGAGIYHD